MVPRWNSTTISVGPERPYSTRSALDQATMRELLIGSWERDSLRAIHDTSGIHKDDLLFNSFERPAA
ncbi:MAG: hypothetical protein R2818_01945 [Flavobacteriales bacterium]